MKNKEKTTILTKIRTFKKSHPDLFEFILFNVMSNVATVVNFMVLWVSTGFIFNGLSMIDFHWFIFNYSVKEGGLGGFLSFLLAYTIAQVVNFFVQRKYVFSATVEIKKVMPWYILTVVFAGIVSIWLPPYVIQFTQPYLGGFAPTAANIINIIIQVMINYPMMKFKIMKKE